MYLFHKKAARMNLSTSRHQVSVMVLFCIVVSMILEANLVLADEPVLPKTPSAPSNMTYPVTRIDPVTDNYHGREVIDNYRWLEDVESDETAQWVEAQNKTTRAYLDSLPSREPMRKRLEQLWNYERFSPPEKVGNRYLYSHNNGLQNQSLLYVSESLGEERRLLLDPNTLSEDGTVALGGWHASDDGNLLAYSLADGGSDWRTWKVRNVETGKDIEDEIRWSKFSGVAWLLDQSGFFYSRYDAPADGAELTGTNEFQKLFFHKLGTPQSADQLVFEKSDEPKWGFAPEVTEDGRYLVIHNWKGSEPKSQIFVKDLTVANSIPIPLVEGFDADYEFVSSNGSVMFLMTDNGAPKRRVIAVDVANPARDAWKEVIAQSDDVLESVSLFGDVFFANYLHDALGRVMRYSLVGQSLGEVALPGLGSVTGFAGKRDDKETFFTFENYITPSSIYRYDLVSDEITLWREPTTLLNKNDYVTEQIFCQSKDGTRVPIIVTRRKTTVLDGSNRTVLYAYGGFNISLTPAYSPAIAGWIESGGVYAVANLRGGGEFGREWHEDGMRLKKQNVFDDFIASAEHLIAQGYTSQERLAIRGGSNGGLLVGAVMTQRPDLYAVCLPAVGVMDMLRFHKFTIGWAWATEFGSSDEADQVDNLLSYSPLHNLNQGTCYPATMVSTADRDDRVVPGHSFKFAAALQHAQGCDHPTLIRIETRAGHGAGTPISKRIEEYADMWAFVIENTR
jgi:prolyl oligopeptidase